MKCGKKTVKIFSHVAYPRLVSFSGKSTRTFHYQWRAQPSEIPNRELKLKTKRNCQKTNNAKNAKQTNKQTKNGSAIHLFEIWNNRNVCAVYLACMAHLFLFFYLAVSWFVRLTHPRNIKAYICSKFLFSQKLVHKYIEFSNETNCFSWQLYSPFCHINTCELPYCDVRSIVLAQWRPAKRGLLSSSV